LQDRYTIERELDRGGMATVYLARDLKHHRAAAIKVLRTGLAATVGMLATSVVLRLPEQEAVVLKRVSYISKFSRPLSREEITQLAADAAERNRSLGVTGMLMSSGGIFYQVLEGPVEAVDRLFQKIAADPRHKDVLVLTSQEEVEDRQFPSWAMKKVNLDEEAASRLEPIKALLEAIVVQREAMQRLMRVLSRSVWHELMEDEPGGS
jgi:serine/threonine protein kinase